MQADMVLEELRVLHLEPQATGRESHWAWLGLLKPKAISQGHIASNKSTTTPTKATHSNPSQVVSP